MIEQFTNIEILMETDADGDHAITTVEETIYVESIVLFTELEVPHVDTLIIERPINLTQTVRFKSPLFFDILGKQTWLC